MVSRRPKGPTGARGGRGTCAERARSHTRPRRGGEPRPSSRPGSALPPTCGASRRGSGPAFTALSASGRERGRGASGAPPPSRGRRGASSRPSPTEAAGPSRARAAGRRPAGAPSPRRTGGLLTRARAPRPASAPRARAPARRLPCAAVADREDLLGWASRAPLPRRAARLPLHRPLQSSARPPLVRTGGSATRRRSRAGSVRRPPLPVPRLADGPWPRGPEIWPGTGVGVAEGSPPPRPRPLPLSLSAGNPPPPRQDSAAAAAAA